jgi:hypothetical protein
VIQLRSFPDAAREAPWQLPKRLTRGRLAPIQAIRFYSPAGCPHCRRQRHASPARSIDAVSQRSAEDGIPPRANRPVGRRSVSQDRQDTSTSFPERDRHWIPANQCLYRGPPVENLGVRSSVCRTLRAPRFRGFSRLLAECCAQCLVCSVCPVLSVSLPSLGSPIPFVGWPYGTGYVLSLCLIVFRENEHHNICRSVT